MNLTSQRSPFVMVDVAIAISGIANNSEQQPSRVEASNPNLRMTSLSPRPPERPRRISRTVLSKHDVKDEEVPPNRFHDPKVQEAFRNAKALMSRLADALGSSPLHINPDSTIRQLHRQAQKLAHFQPPSTRTVGFVGDSGVVVKKLTKSSGKSSLLNSLLDLEGLARTSNSGAACTCVVTEYHFHDQTDFITYVELFSVDDLVKQAEDLLKSYRHYHLNSDEMEGNELSDFKEQAQVALDTFRAMFRGRYDDEEFLTEDRLKVALRTLKSRVVELRPSEIEGRQVDTNLQDCSTRLMRLTSEVASSREPALWPYIKKIKVSLNSHILSKGLVLVDLPGLRDLNSARRAITERYLIECDEIFAICNIGRATTDVGVASVFDLAKEAGLENVGIVCTKSDDIRAAEAKKDWKGPRARKVQQLSDAVAATQRQLDDINLDLADFEDADDLSEEERNLIIDLGFRAKKTQQALEHNKFELKKYLIQTRNASVIGQLREHYGKHDDSDEDSEDDSEDEGVPDEIPVFCDLTGRDSMINGIYNIVKDNFSVQIYDIRNTVDWRETAIDAGYEWTGWHHASYSAFCRQFGNYCTPAAGSHNWNEEIIHGMVTTLSSPWRNVSSTFSYELEKITDHVVRVIEGEIDALEGGLGDLSESSDTICQLLSCRKNILVSEMEDLCGKFEGNLRVLKINALSGIRTSLIGEAMEASYRACNLEAGTGSDRRRKGIINDAIQDEELFPNLMKEFRKRLYSSTRELRDNLQTTIQRHLEIISSTMDIIRSENVATESEENPELRHLLDSEVTAIRDQMQQIQETIDA
ncbi:Nuclear GTPase SLIP-GC 3 [Colletotrichum truncatum]|uniref:Nuclear GTPase SLIP-GC 3 n=1 Tax=Colletotrichum truncatum TaxID=5467 RepID=A0ACC3YJA7_COLTU